MSEATRAVALAEAGKLNLTTANEVLAAAAAYDAFLTETAEAATPKAAVAATKAGAATKTTKPTKPTKSEEEVVKAALEAQRAEAEAAEGEEGADGGDEPTSDDALPATKDGAQAAVARLLKVNKRKEAIGLLKKFGAASVSGIKPKDFGKFVAEAVALTGSADDDLTA